MITIIEFNKQTNEDTIDNITYSFSHVERGCILFSHINADTYPE